MADCIYLRKSRVDAEAEAHGSGDTLARHEKELLQTAEKLGRTITHIYREVVSGETISARPEMQQLLRDVEQGLWDAVHVMEVERLARGDTLDQGIVSQTFLYSKTLIITPKKTYDPSNEFDEEYFEFGLFMSRREYKTINRRQQAGRLASLREGKWVANKAPYGYRRIKLQEQKGWSLEAQEPQAPIVCDIFRWLTLGYEEAGCFIPLGTSQIAHRLNHLGIPSPSGGVWGPNSVRDILRNDAYAGWVHWGRRATQKTLCDGTVVTSRPRADLPSYQRFPGLHPPLIPQDTFNLAQTILGLGRHPSRPGPKQAKTQNPLAGLVFCGACGHSMVRRPYASGRPDALLCPYPSCPTKSSDLTLVETALLSTLADWLSNLEAPKHEACLPIRSAERDALQRALVLGEKKLDLLRQQEARAFELVEQGVYSPEQFIQRTTELKKRTESQLQNQERIRLELTMLESGAPFDLPVLPKLHHVLDSYPTAQDAAEKNRLLISLLSRVIYLKTTGGRYQESNLQLILFPRVQVPNPHG